MKRTRSRSLTETDNKCKTKRSRSLCANKRILEELSRVSKQPSAMVDTDENCSKNGQKEGAYNDKNGDKAVDQVAEMRHKATQNRGKKSSKRTRITNPDCKSKSAIITRSRSAATNADVSTNGVSAKGDIEARKRKSIPLIRKNTFGHIPGVPIGTIFSSRMDCSKAGVHRPTMAGIHGNASDGCFSVALSGGYEDNLDNGDWFTYCGEGGRNLKGTKSLPKNLRTGPQTKDQNLTKGNLHLSLNVHNMQPVRVIRGFNLNNIYSPDKGYRYDGLYNVQRFWTAPGNAGHNVYKYAFIRCKNQEPGPWESNPCYKAQVNNEVTTADSSVGDEVVAQTNMPNDAAVAPDTSKPLDDDTHSIIELHSDEDDVIILN